MADMNYEHFLNPSFSLPNQYSFVPRFQLRKRESSKQQIQWPQINSFTTTSPDQPP